MKDNILEKIIEAVEFIRTKSALKIDSGIILGSGLGNLVDGMEVDAEVDYGEIPHFPISTTPDHSGKLLLGRRNEKDVAVMQGRVHYYEGYSAQQITFPVRVINALGAKNLFITNASGGLNPEFKTGDLMIVKDHINLNVDHPLRGKNEDSLGPRFPDQHQVYDATLISKALEIAAKNNIICHTGVYVGVTGPTFETPAEYRYLRMIGGDAVGMSTVTEAIVANHCGMRIFCISVITNEGNAPELSIISHEEVINAAQAAGRKIGVILKELLR
jgi:purine-nucleoside phosphorylase